MRALLSVDGLLAPSVSFFEWLYVAPGRVRMWVSA